MVSEQVDGWTVFAEKPGAPRRVRPGAQRQRLPERRLCLQRRVRPRCPPIRSPGRGRAAAPLQTAFDRQPRARRAAGRRDREPGRHARRADRGGHAPGRTGSRSPRPSAATSSSARRATTPTFQVAPGGAIFYLSFNGVGDRINKLVDSLGDSISELRPAPRADRARARLSARGRLRAARRRGCDRPLPDRERDRRPSSSSPRSATSRRQRASSTAWPPSPRRAEAWTSARSRSARSRRRKSTSPTDVGLRRRLRREARDDEQPLRAREDAGERAEAGRRLRIQDGCGPSGGARGDKRLRLRRHQGSARVRVLVRGGARGARSRRSPRKTPRHSGACSCTDRRTGAI